MPMRCALIVSFCLLTLSAHAQGGQSTPLAAGVSPSDNPQPAPPQGPVRLSQGIVAGQLLTHFNPVYPEKAKKQKIQGTVLLRAVIGKDGHISSLTPVSGPDLLIQASMDAVSKWTYRPYTLNGLPKEVETTITVNFTLNQNEVR